MGKFEMIWPDGSGIEFKDNGIASERYTRCDGCQEMFKLRELKSYLVGVELDGIWLCKGCGR